MSRRRTADRRLHSTAPSEADAPLDNAEYSFTTFSIAPLEPLAEPLAQRPRTTHSFDAEPVSLLVASSLVDGSALARSSYGDARFRVPALPQQEPDALTSSSSPPRDPVFDRFVQGQQRRQHPSTPCTRQAGLGLERQPLFPSLDLALCNADRQTLAPSPPPSSNSSSSSSSSFWEDHDAPCQQPDDTGSTIASRPCLLSWTAFRDAHGGGSTVSTRAGAYLTDYAFLDARGEHKHANISEAVLEHLDPVPPPTDLVTYRPAPTHAVADVLASLLVTASTASTSPLFHWDEAMQRFEWAHTIQRRRDKETERRETRRRRKLEARLAREGRPLQQGDQAGPQWEWWSTERIEGWTEQASDSVVQPFLDVGTLLRRLESRLHEVRLAGTGIKEAPALAFALDNVLEWLKAELATWSESGGRAVAGTSDILNTASELEPTLQVLQTLANLLSCAMSRIPPLKPLVWLRSSSACLTHLHSHLVASTASRSSPLSQALLAYLLDRTSATWRVDVATWIGWPGYGSNRTGELDQDLVALSTRDSARSAGEWRESKRATPWSGAEIEWALDERGEEDVGYTLRPSAVPSFVGLGDARDFLEAGRALRLLKKAAPPGHPLVSAWTLDGEDDAESGASLRLPTWVWNSADARALSASVESRVAKLRGDMARWRRSRMRETHNPRSISLSSSGGGGGVNNAISSGGSERGPPTSASLVPFPTAKAEAPLDKSALQLGTTTMGDRFAKMSRLFDALPASVSELEQEETVGAGKFVAPPSASADLVNDAAAVVRQRTSRNDASPRDDLVAYLASYLTSPLDATRVTAASITPLTLAQLTRSTLVSPLQTWSRLISSALISVFFQDLGLATYLETCKRFLLLGSDRFERRISAALFDSGEEDEAEQPVPLNAGAVALSDRLTGDGKWPPTDALLSSSLNSAVLETVSGMRAANAERIEAAARTGDGRSAATASSDAAVSLALRDLDDRLSFAVVDPSLSSTPSSRRDWTDPHSIAALDWLTLSFHPPPLIAPLLTQLAQMRYQRLWNLLLRLKRVRVAMRACFQRCFGKASRAGDVEGLDEPTLRIARRFHWSARHFLDVVEGYVHEIGIEWHWSRFMHRLERVRRSVADDVPSPSADTLQDGGTAGHGVDAHDEDDDDDEEEGGGYRSAPPSDDDDPDFATTPRHNGQQGPASASLHDVFSLSRYHERVLDRMLDTCFLKQRQRRLLRILSDILQTQLDFCHAVLHPSPSSSSSMRTEMAALEMRHAKRVRIFVKALLVVRDRGGAESNATWPDTAKADDDRDDDGDGKTSARRRDLEGELERQQREWERDLEMLEFGPAGSRRGGAGAGGHDRGATGGAKMDPVEILLARLNGSGFYIRDGGVSAGL